MGTIAVEKMFILQELEPQWRWPNLVIPQERTVGDTLAFPSHFFSLMSNGRGEGEVASDSVLGISFATNTIEVPEDHHFPLR